MMKRKRMEREPREMPATAPADNLEFVEVAGAGSGVGDDEGRLCSGQTELFRLKVEQRDLVLLSDRLTKQVL